MRNSWDEILKNKLEDFEVEPPADAWAGISKGIQTRKKKKAIWFLSIAAGIILLAGISWMFLKQETSSKELAQPEFENLPQVAESTLPVNPKKEDTTHLFTPEKPAFLPRKKSNKIPAPEKIQIPENQAGIAKIDSTSPSIQFPVNEVKEQFVYREENIDVKNLSEGIENSPISASESPEIQQIPAYSYSTLGNAFNLAGTILNNDTGWKEELTSTTRKVEVTASLGFISFKKQSTYKLQ